MELRARPLGRCEASKRGRRRRSKRALVAATLTKDRNLASLKYRGTRSRISASGSRTEKERPSGFHDAPAASPPPPSDAAACSSMAYSLTGNGWRDPLSQASAVARGALPLPPPPSDNGGRREGG